MIPVISSRAVFVMLSRMFMPNLLKEDEQPVYAFSAAGANEHYR
jgi:hypothetical protein